MPTNGDIQDELTPVPGLMPEEAFAELKAPEALAELHRGLGVVAARVSRLFHRVGKWEKTFDARAAAIVMQASEETGAEISRQILRELGDAMKRVDKVEDDRGSSPTINNYLTKPDSEPAKSLPIPKELKPYFKKYHTWIALFLFVGGLVTWAVKEWVQAMVQLRGH